MSCFLYSVYNVSALCVPWMYVCMSAYLVVWHHIYVFVCCPQTPNVLCLVYLSTSFVHVFISSDVVDMSANLAVCFSVSICGSFLNVCLSVCSFLDGVMDFH